MAVALPFVPLISAGVGAVAAIGSAAARARAARTQAEIDEKNRVIALNNAAVAEEAGGDRARQQDIVTRHLIGRQTAAQSVSGLSVLGRSFSMTRDHAVRLAEQDRKNIKAAAKREAESYINAAETHATNALYRQQEAGSAMAAGFLNATSAVINQIPAMHNYGTLKALGV